MTGVPDAGGTTTGGSTTGGVTTGAGAPVQLVPHPPWVTV